MNCQSLQKIDGKFNFPKKSNKKIKWFMADGFRAIYSQFGYSFNYTKDTKITLIVKKK